MPTALAVSAARRNAPGGYRSGCRGCRLLGKHTAVAGDDTRQFVYNGNGVYYDNDSVRPLFSLVYVYRFSAGAAVIIRGRRHITDGQGVYKIIRWRMS